MHFFDDMYFLWLFWGLINDDNFHFSPSKLFPFGDEGILPYLSFFLRYVPQRTCQPPKGRDSEPRAGKSSEWAKRQQ